MKPSVRLLGSPCIELGGVVHDLEASRASATLYYLARKAGWASRDELTYLFWPDVSPERSLGSLRYLVHVMRQVPAASGLEVERSRIRWYVVTDIPSVHTLAAGPVWGIDQYLRPFTFLDGFALRNAPEFDNWLLMERSFWDERLRADLFRSLDLSLERGSPDYALALADAWLRHRPLDEEPVRRSLEICRKSGMVDEGDRRFNEFAAELHRELGLQPSAALERAHAELIATSFVQRSRRPVQRGAP